MHCKANRLTISRPNAIVSALRRSRVWQTRETPVRGTESDRSGYTWRPDWEPSATNGEARVRSCETRISKLRRAPHRQVMSDRSSPVDERMYGSTPNLIRSTRLLGNCGFFGGTPRRFCVQARAKPRFDTQNVLPITQPRSGKPLTVHHVHSSVANGRRRRASTLTTGETTKRRQRSHLRT